MEYDCEEEQQENGKCRHVVEWYGVRRAIEPDGSHQEESHIEYAKVHLLAALAAVPGTPLPEIKQCQEKPDEIRQAKNTSRDEVRTAITVQTHGASQWRCSYRTPACTFTPVEQLCIAIRDFKGVAKKTK